MRYKQLAAVFVSVLLVVAAGSVVALPATDVGDDAIEETEEAIQQQGNETGNETGNATVGNESDDVTAGNETNVTGNQTGDAPEELDTSGNASLVVENQSSNGSAVVVQGAYLAEGGFVEVTDDNGFAVGNSTYLPAGINENVTVQLDQPLAGNQTVTVFALRDENGNQMYDGVSVDNDSDQPYVDENGSAVTADANVTVTGEPDDVTADDGANATDANATTNATAGNETNATDAGNATDGNATDNVTANESGNASDNASVSSDLGSNGNATDNETANATDGDDANVTAGDETNATNETGVELATASSDNASVSAPAEQNATGNGTSLNVTNASADVRYYLEVRGNQTVYNTTVAFESNETFSGELMFEPEVGNSTELNVTVREAGNGSVLVGVNVTYTVLDETANATANATDDNATDADNATDNVTANVTDDNATANATDDNATDATVGNDTNATVGNDTNVTTNETATASNATANATGNASATFENQTSNGTAVVVQNVTVPDGGFVTLHDDRLFEGMALESVVGVSDYLDAGTHENVTVSVFTNATYSSEETFVAMPHRDTNGNETYDFVETNGSEDGPYVADGEPVIDNATVTFETGLGNETATNETATNESDGSDS